MPMIEANGVKLNVLQMPHPDPSAEHLVMLHGLATNMAFWYLRLAPALNERFPCHPLRPARAWTVGKNTYRLSGKFPGVGSDRIARSAGNRAIPPDRP